MSILQLSTIQVGYLLQRRYEVYSSLTGFIGGSGGTLFKTTNGGASWQDISVSSSYDINDVYFLTEDTGFIATATGLRKTVDGGSTWSIEVGSADMKHVVFLDKSIGYAVGESSSRGVMHKTTDGGNFWFKLILIPWPGVMSPLSAVHFLDKDNGYAVGPKGVSISTSDAGSTWSGKKYGDQSDPDRNDVHYAASGKAYIVGARGYLKIMPDYTNLNREIEHDILGIDFYGTRGLAVGKNGVYRSVPEISSDFFSVVAFSSSITAFAVGTGGVVTRLTYEP